MLVRIWRVMCQKESNVPCQYSYSLPALSHTQHCWPLQHPNVGNLTATLPCDIAGASTTTRLLVQSSASGQIQKFQGKLLYLVNKDAGVPEGAVLRLLRVAEDMCG